MFDLNEDYFYVGSEDKNIYHMNRKNQDYKLIMKGH